MKVIITDETKANFNKLDGSQGSRKTRNPKRPT